MRLEPPRPRPPWFTVPHYERLLGHLGQRREVLPHRRVPPCLTTTSSSLPGPVPTACACAPACCADLKSKFGKFATLAPVIGLGGAYPDGDGLAVGVMYHDGDSSSTPSLTHLSQDEQVRARARRGDYWDPKQVPEVGQGRHVWDPASQPLMLLLLLLLLLRQTTMLTLWSVARAPLIVTAQLPLLANDTWTLPLLTNAEVLLVQNASHGNRPIPTLQNASSADVHAWAATPDGADSSSDAYFALFNAADAPGPVSVALASGGLAPAGNYCARDLWAHIDLPSVSGGTFGVALLPAHGAGMYRLHAC